MTRAYSNPARADDPHALPDIEVFYAKPGELGDTEEGEPYPQGWYWWSCSPGCLPDGGAIGPFETEADALADAQEDFVPEDESNGGQF